MADKKISQLTALSAANLAPSTDVLAIVDTSATETKKIAAQDIVNGVLNVASAVGIGTASPGAYRLNVQGGSSSFTYNAANQYAGEFYNSNATGYGLYVQGGGAGSRAALNVLDYAGASILYAGNGNNVGIGTVSPGAKLHVLGSNFVGIFAGTNANTVYTEYRYNSTTTSGLIGNGSSLLSAAADSDFIVRSEGALKFATNGNNFRAVIDSSGNLGIGTTSPADTNSFGRALDIRSSTGAAAYFRDSDDATKYSVAGFFGADSNAYYGSWGTGTGVLFYSAGSERARITAAGYFKASDSGTYRNAAGVYHELRNSDGSNPTVFVTNSNASTPYGIAVEFTAAAPDNNTQFFFRAEDNVAIRCYIWADGDLANHDGVYGTISDERLKQDIVDAGSQWDDLKSIRFRKYRMKTDVEANPDAPAMFGVVAQELAQVCPGLVDEHPNMKTVEVTDEEGNVTQTQEPDGTTTLTVKSSILLMKAAKALQEAMARIEQLEADMAALKASA
jgi:hypothetical protein